MYCPKTNRWKAPPPNYDCILQGPSNLNDYLNFTEENDDENESSESQKLGSILTLSQLLYNYNFAAESS